MNTNEIIYSSKNTNLVANLDYQDWKGQSSDKLLNDSNKCLTIVIFGATGGSGIEMIKEALARGHKGKFCKTEINFVL